MTKLRFYAAAFRKSALIFARPQDNSALFAGEERLVLGGALSVASITPPELV